VPICRHGVGGGLGGAGGGGLGGGKPQSQLCVQLSHGASGQLQLLVHAVHEEQEQSDVHESHASSLQVHRSVHDGHDEQTQTLSHSWHEEQMHWFSTPPRHTSHGASGHSHCSSHFSHDDEQRQPRVHSVQSPGHVQDSVHSGHVRSVPSAWQLSGHVLMS